MSRRLIVALATSVSIAGLCCPVPARGVGPAARRIVSRAMVKALPEPLQTRFASQIDAIIERAEEPATVWPRSAAFRARKHWHYLMLDVAADAPSSESRCRAAQAFPRTPSAARQLFRQHDVDRGGRLPWQLEILTEDLSSAFASGDEPSIVRSMGLVVHFATDAKDPFCVSRNRRGGETGNTILGDCALGDPLFAHQDAAQRLGWELIRRNEQRYLEQVDAVTGTVTPASDYGDTIFTAMSNSLASLDGLCEADRRVFEQMELADGKAFMARQDEFYVLLDSAGGPTCVENLAGAARLAAALVAGAWQNAGAPERVEQSVPRVARPGAPSETPRAPEAAPAPPKEGEAQAGGHFCASRNSQVFHLPTCPHAQRISPENLVWFSTLQEALDSGRRPCKTCRPDGA